MDDDMRDATYEAAHQQQLEQQQIEEEAMSNLTARLADIQKKLNAPKSQFNKFGGYNYRSCEDILVAVKPLLGDLALIVSDGIVAVGDRVYVKAVATLTDGKDSIVATAFAREALEKKGMDAAQVTGSTSSYARKYALNGLLLIDDNKDADHGHESDRQAEQPARARPNKPASAPKPAPAALDLDDAIDLLSQQIDEQSLKEAFAKLWKAASADQKEALKSTYDHLKTQFQHEAIPA